MSTVRALTEEQSQRLIGAPLTDLGNAERLIAAHGCDLRYVHQWKAWIVWDDRRGTWRRDESGEVGRRLHATIRETHRLAIELPGEPGATLAKHAIKSESRRAICAAIELAASLAGVSVAPADLDADAWKLNTLSGVVDLRTGELSRHQREHLMARQCAATYSPSATCPRWTRFISEITSGDDDLAEWLRRFAGYSLVGTVQQHLFAFLYGAGANGKSTFTKTIAEVTGTYSTHADASTFLRQRDEGRPRPDLARLVGARVVVAEEPGADTRLDEATIKKLTGGDTVTARFLYGNEFEFDPVFTLWFSTNVKPRIEGRDDGIWRRVKLVPFREQFLGDRADLTLANQLAPERPGILAWMVRGCLAWQADGFNACAAIDRATEDYRDEEDVIAAFLSECCQQDPSISCAGSVLYRRYAEHARERGENAVSNRAFARELRAKGFEQARTASCRIWRGIDLVADADPGWER